MIAESDSSHVYYSDNKLYFIVSANEGSTEQSMIVP